MSLFVYSKNLKSNIIICIKNKALHLKNTMSTCIMSQPAPPTTLERNNIYIIQDTTQHLRANVRSIAI